MSGYPTDSDCFPSPWRGWVTNDPKSAAMLREADLAYRRAYDAARGLSLADKVVALRAAKIERQAVYASVAARAAQGWPS